MALRAEQNKGEELSKAVATLGYVRMCGPASVRLAFEMWYRMKTSRDGRAEELIVLHVCVYWVWLGWLIVMVIVCPPHTVRGIPTLSTSSALRIGRPKNCSTSTGKRGRSCAACVTSTLPC